MLTVALDDGVPDGCVRVAAAHRADRARWARCSAPITVEAP